jgi:hypothetical protein
MTSETGVESECACGLSSILNDLGRLASLEYPIYSPSLETSINSNTGASVESTEPTPLEYAAYTMPVPRLPFPPTAALKHNLCRTTQALCRPFSNSGPPLGAWTGRRPDEHAVNRTDEKDVQSKPSHQGMREKDQGESNSRGISEEGGEDNKKAEQEKPDAPRPVIGMNDERGGKGH